MRGGEPRVAYAARGHGDLRVPHRWIRGIRAENSASVI